MAHGYWGSRYLFLIFVILPGVLSFSHLRPSSKRSLHIQHKSYSSVTPKVLRNVAINALQQEDMSYAAWEWMANMGAPSALVGGAALASFFDLRTDLEVDPNVDRPWARLVKKVISLFLLSAFAFEISCVFITTVTGTLLQSHTINGLALSSIDLMTRELEFEYLASRIMFFQGLLNWLCGIAFHQILPSPSTAGKAFSDLSVEEKAARRLRLSNGASVATLAMMMLAFYNNHVRRPYFFYIILKMIEFI